MEHHGAPFAEGYWLDFCLHLSQHQSELSRTDLFRQSLCRALLDFAAPWVVHCADHFPFTLFAYCPRLYHSLLCATIFDPKVFAAHHLTPSQVYSQFKQLVPEHLATQYVWGFRWHKPLPSAYIFPKEKKAFTTARRVNTFDSALLSPVGVLLRDLTQTAFPQ